MVGIRVCVGIDCFVGLLIVGWMFLSCNVFVKIKIEDSVIVLVVRIGDRSILRVG